MKSLRRDELDKLLAVTREESFLDYMMFLVTFNHGLRVSEVVGPKGLNKTNIVGDYIVVDRLKQSKKTSHPLLPDEKSFLLSLEGVFFPTSRYTFWRKMQYYGMKAGIPQFKCHPHALKHTTGRLGYIGGMGLPELQTYLGHKNGGNTMTYAEAGEDEAASAFAAAVGK